MNVEFPNEEPMTQEEAQENAKRPLCHRSFSTLMSIRTVLPGGGSGSPLALPGGNQQPVNVQEPVAVVQNCRARRCMMWDTTESRCLDRTEALARISAHRASK